MTLHTPCSYTVRVGLSYVHESVPLFYPLAFLCPSVWRDLIHIPVKSDIKKRTNALHGSGANSDHRVRKLEEKKQRKPE